LEVEAAGEDEIDVVTAARAVQRNGLGAPGLLAAGAGDGHGADERAAGAVEIDRNRAAGSVTGRARGEAGGAVEIHLVELEVRAVGDIADVLPAFGAVFGLHIGGGVIAGGLRVNTGAEKCKPFDVEQSAAAAAVEYEIDVVEPARAAEVGRDGGPRLPAASGRDLNGADERAIRAVEIDGNCSPRSRR